MAFPEYSLIINLLTILGILGGGALLARSFRKKQGRATALTSGVLLLAVTALLGDFFHPQWGDARMRPWLSFYSAIHEGMTREEVLATIAKSYTAPTAEIPAPVMAWDEPGKLGFFMDPGSRSKEPNCEGIFLEMRDGRVVSKDYSQD